MVEGEDGKVDVEYEEGEPDDEGVVASVNGAVTLVLPQSLMAMVRPCAKRCIPHVFSRTT